tara:strand:- start:12182 stop:12802 length:621 start_codon:yes stop_codon:yes gene_type:complete
MKTMADKLKWTAGLLVVFLLILATNLVDRQHFRRVKESVVTIYEDRLVAKDLVFELTLLVEEKRLAILRDDLAFFNGRSKMVNDSIGQFVEQFYGTRLTREEKGFLDSFASHMKELRVLEADWASKNKNAQEAKAVFLGRIDAMEKDLYALSKIQLAEGKRQLQKATKSVDAMDYLTQLEVIALVIIGLSIQIIVLYKPRNKEENT